MDFSHFTLPFEDPVLKFLVVLIIILFAPLLLNKIKVPHLLGLIIAGAAVGPFGFNILTRDASIVVTGTTGLLYIMFLAGLEIDLAEFKKNKWKSLGFGAFTFLFPFAFGILAGHYILGFNWLTTFLFSSLFSSHTLISYPIVSKLGITRNAAVTSTVGGTMITDVLALLVLAIVVGMTTGEVNSAFWTRMSVGIVAFALIVLFGFPIVGRWFFKKVDDRISQYIFVLVMIYLASLLAELAGVEAIIGAFLAGLALNGLIPRSSSLMNRIDFVGNAIFIPFFLISVGMLIDVKVFFNDLETLKVAAVMISVSIGGKYLAAKATARAFKFTKAESGIIFGLSSASAAATLAAVLVGYNIIIGETDAGEPIRLLNESILNGSILLILVSCTVSSFVTQKNAQAILETDNENTMAATDSHNERLLLALNYSATVEPITNLSLLLKSKNNTKDLFAINVIDDETDESLEKNAVKLLEESSKIGASADVEITPLKRFDSDVQRGISNAIKEHKISDLILAVDADKGFSTSLVYNLYNGYLRNTTVNTLVYHAVQPIATVRRYMVVFPDNAHLEAGFFHSLLKIWNISRSTGAKIEFFGEDKTIKVLERIQKKVNIEAAFYVFSNWAEMPKVFKKMKDDDAFVLFMARRGMVSYLPQMQNVPAYLNTHFSSRNYLLVFPSRNAKEEYGKLSRDISNADDFMEIGNIVGKIFK